jgi:hypothetical protein
MQQVFELLRQEVHVFVESMYRYRLFYFALLRRLTGRRL